MAGIYSTQFFLVPGGTNGVYTVPAGQTAVVRCVTVYNRSSSATEQYAIAVSPGGAAIVFGFAGANSGAAGESAIYIDLRVVLTSGQEIFSANGANIDMSCSGYLFVV